MMLQFLEAVTGIFVVVYDGQHGLRFTLGRAQDVVPPGVHFKLPIIQKIEVEDTRHTTLDLEPQVIQLKDDLVYEVDCKVLYQIIDLRRAMIEVDDLVTGMQNRVVIAIQQVVQEQDRESVKDTAAMSQAIRERLADLEEQWGVRILQLGFANISPSPTTLEITQLDLLAREKLELYEHFREHGLQEDSSVALISGAVVALGQEQRTPLASERKERERESIERLATLAEDVVRKAPEEPEPPARLENDEFEEDEDRE